MSNEPFIGLLYGRLGFADHSFGLKCQELQQCNGGLAMLCKS